MKGNLFLGMGRGSVGDVVYSRVGGQQVGRARNRKPNNPRSASQMFQRSLFGSAVKFFAKGRQAFFTYGFESKKSSESDYNAFMRINAKNGVNMTKDMLDNFDYPAIGRWQMTQGSLPGFTTTFDNDTKKFNTPLVKMSQELSGITLGMLSNALIASGDFMLGDIVTVVEIRTNSFAEDGSDPIPVVVDGGINWIIEQFIVDPTSTQLISGLFSNFVFAKSDDGDLLISSQTLSSAVDQIGGMCVVHSRKVQSKLRVSNTFLCNSHGVELALGKCELQSYIDYVLVDWQSRPDAILEGSLAKARVAPVADFTPALPASAVLPSEGNAVLTTASPSVIQKALDFIDAGNDVSISIYVGSDLYEPELTYNSVSGIASASVADETVSIEFSLINGTIYVENMTSSEIVVALTDVTYED